MNSEYVRTLAQKHWPGSFVRVLRMNGRYRAELFFDAENVVFADVGETHFAALQFLSSRIEKWSAK